MTQRSSARDCNATSEIPTGPRKSGSEMTGELPGSPESSSKDGKRKRMVPLSTLAGPPMPREALAVEMALRKLSRLAQTDALTPEHIRKRFLSLRGRTQREFFLLKVMRHYPIKVFDSGLFVPLFDTRARLTTNGKTLWLHRLAEQSNKARRAFDKLNKRQQGLLVMVLPEEWTIQQAAKHLGVTRKHCHALFWQTIESLFPEYKHARPRPTVRHLREILALSMEPETSWREQSRNSEDYLDHLAAGRESGECGYNHSDEENYSHSNEDRE